jgi:hypothetical protein
MSREPLSVVDAAWLAMGSDENPMVITVVLTFATPIDRAALVAMLRKTAAHPRFRSRAVRHVGGGYWEEDRRFDVEAHVSHVACPAPGDRAALEEIVGDLQGQPLDPERPLWRATLVDGVEGGSAVVLRLHHALGDGVALVAMLLDLSDEAKGMLVPEVGQARTEAHGAVDFAKLAASHAATLGRLLLLPPDPDTPLRGPLGTRKRVAWTRPLPLDRVKAAAKAVGVKVNDVLVALVSAALTDELELRGAMKDGLEIHALLPVFLRGAVGGLGNHFGLVFLALPLGVRTPLERVRAVARRMDRLKSGEDAAVAWEVLAAMGAASAEIERIGVDLFSKKASVMITNVPGPPMPVPLSGHVIDDIIVFAPVSGHIGVGVSFLSYAGHVRGGIAADARLVPEPSRLVRAMEAHFEELEATIAQAGPRPR